MKTAFYLILLALTFNVLAQQPPPTPEFDMPVDQTTVPFELVDSKIYFEAEVNGIKKKFILDTGAGIPAMIVNNAFAKELGLEFLDPFPNGIGLGEDPKEVAPSKGTVAIQIGDLNVGNVPVLRTALHEILEPFYGVPPDGVFGGPIFQNFVVSIDFEKNEFTIMKSESFNDQGIGEAIAVELNQGRPVADATFVLENGDEIKGSFTVDTGARTTFFHKSFIVKSEMAPSDTIALLGGVGFSGRLYGHRTKMQSMTLGNFQMKDAPVLLGTNQEVEAGENFGDDGLIGYDFLKNFFVTFDYKNKKFYLKKQRELIPFVDKSGLFLSVTSDKIFKVEDVIKDSPADKAGIKVGDQITTVNDKASGEYQLQEVNTLLKGEPGDRISMKITRDQSVKTIRFKLKDLISSR